MTEKLAKKASELLKEKSELLDDLSKLVPNKTHHMQLGYVIVDTYSRFDLYKLNCNNNIKITIKIKNILIEEINNRIKEIDIELENLSC
jgi:hypothetical protein